VIKALTNTGRTILVVEESAARIADQAALVALLDNGQFAWTGGGAELMQRPKILETYLGA
jgi:branched-chain amino acid transport system ATP-binding protein